MLTVLALRASLLAAFRIFILSALILLDADKGDAGSLMSAEYHQKPVLSFSRFPNGGVKNLNCGES